MYVCAYVCVFVSVCMYVCVRVCELARYQLVIYHEMRVIGCQSVNMSNSKTYSGLRSNPKPRRIEIERREREFFL